MAQSKGGKGDGAGIRTDGTWQAAGAAWTDAEEFLDAVVLADADRLRLGLPPVTADDRTGRRLAGLTVKPAGFIDSLTADERHHLALGLRIRRPVGRAGA